MRRELKAAKHGEAWVIQTHLIEAKYPPGTIVVVDTGQIAYENDYVLAEVWHGKEKVNVFRKYIPPNPCPQCEDAAAEGDIDLEDDFGGDAGDAPPLHPNCECSLDLFVADEAEEEKRMSDDDDNDDDGQRHIVDELADLLVEGGSPDGPVTREHALQWLLHSERGQALVARMARARKRTSKGKSVMDKTPAVLNLAKAFADEGVSFMPEAHLSAMIEQYALRDQRSGETPAQCFARVVCADSPEGLTFRKALQACRGVGVTPRVGDDVDVALAYRKLERLAADERRRSPHLSQEQAFARVFSDPINKALASRAAPTPSATTYFPHPR